VPDMLDVLHYLFEDDALSSSTHEHIEAKQRVRQMLYRDLYNREYMYAIQSDRDYVSDDVAGEELRLDNEMPTPVDPANRSNSAFPTKRYIPPTTVNANSPKPFGSALDAPLG